MNKYIKMYIQYNNGKVIDYITGEEFITDSYLDTKQIKDPWNRKEITGISSKEAWLTPSDKLMSLFSTLKDFTIAFWIYNDVNNSSSNYIISIAPDGYSGIAFSLLNDNTLQYYTHRSYDFCYTLSKDSISNQWNYIEIYRRYNDKSNYTFSASVNGIISSESYSDTTSYDETHFYLFDWPYWPNRYYNRLCKPVYDFTVYDKINHNTNFKIPRIESIKNNNWSLEIENDNIYGKLV